MLVLLGIAAKKLKVPFIALGRVANGRDNWLPQWLSKVPFLFFFFASN